MATRRNSNKGNKSGSGVMAGPETVGNLALKPGGKVASIATAAAFRSLDAVYDADQSTYGVRAECGRQIIAGGITGEQVREWELDRMAKVGTLTGKDAKETAQLVKDARQRIRNTIRALQNFLRTSMKASGKEQAFNLNKEGTAYVWQRVSHTRRTPRAAQKEAEGKVTNALEKAPEGVAPRVVADWCMAYLSDKDRKPAETAAFRELFAPVAKKLGLI